MSIERAVQLQSEGISVVYLSGPMTGYPEDNYPAFNAAEKQLREWGFEVQNPACWPMGQTRAWYMRRDFQMVARSCAVVLLEGWEASEGANDEVYMGRKCGCRFFDANLNELKITGPMRLHHVAVPVEPVAVSA